MCMSTDRIYAVKKNENVSLPPCATETLSDHGVFLIILEWCFCFHGLLIWKAPRLQVWDIDANQLCYLDAFSVFQNSLCDYCYNPRII